jgi:hypothetical protein
MKRQAFTILFYTPVIASASTPKDRGFKSRKSLRNFIHCNAELHNFVLSVMEKNKSVI